MRLLERNNAGDYSLTKNFVDDDVPRYAILSHTWGADTEEVTLKDLKDGTAKGRTGYSKIRFCGEQAERDGLQHFWVDTCCIDKSDSVELQEAINSMFRWYQNAAKCYVYLSDISTTKRKASDQISESTWEPAFRASRWFTRGWTLQELLAPDSVEFFSKEGNRLGDKSTLERQIYEITGIAISALRGTTLSQFGVDERLSWAQNRETTRKEDLAYSLLGIFDVYMPLIYGEGRDKAFDRLRDEIEKPPKGLDRLPYAAEAPFNSYAKQHSPSCLPDTRVDLLEKIYGWADGQDERCIFWLNGLAGTGKSTIARTVAQRYFDQKRLGASFFFARGGGDVGHAGKFVTSIARQLANTVRPFRRYISDTVMEYSDIATRFLRDQWQLLVLDPISKLDDKTCQTSYVLVVDALDECDDDNSIRIILELLAEARSLKRVRLRVFLTSRPEVPIRHSFYQLPEAERYYTVLHNISPSIVDHDISIFLEHSLRLIGGKDGQDTDWPGRESIDSLVQGASGLFIWADTACRFIRDGLFADERLHALLEGGASAAGTPEEHLDGIYINVLQNSIQPNYSQREKERVCSMIRDILGSVAALFSPLSVDSLSKLLVKPKQRVNRTLRDLHAILDIPDDDTRSLRLHHPSFRDFLLDKGRCRADFWVDQRQAHQMLAESCILLMSKALKRNICGLDAPGVLATNVEKGRVDQHLPSEVQYACLYWVQHLQKSGMQLHDDGQVHQLLQVHLLHWLEALSLMRKTAEGILALLSLDSTVTGEKSSRLQAFIHDAKRFALYNRSVIEEAPLQLYYSALIFAPKRSIVWGHFSDQIPPWICGLQGVSDNWSPLLQTLVCNSEGIRSLVFSPDGKLLASGGGAVHLWDAATGILQQTLKTTSKKVRTVAFSLDSKLIASGSNDYSSSEGSTIRLWDVATGALQHTLESHSKYVSTVEFSPNGKLLASRSDPEGAIKLWDVATGSLHRTLDGVFVAVAFSPDGKLVTSDCRDGTIKLWNANTGALQQTLKSYPGQSNYMATISPNGKLVATGSPYDDPMDYDGTGFVRLWDAATGFVYHTLKGHRSMICAVAFSPDGKAVASVAEDRTVKLWDVATGALRQTLSAHSWVRTAAFSPDGKIVASGSDSEAKIRLWDTVMGDQHQTLKGHSYSVSAVVFSPNGQLLASTDGDEVKLWNAATGALRQTLKGSLRGIGAVIFSLDGKSVAAGYHCYNTRGDGASLTGDQLMTGKHGGLSTSRRGPGAHVTCLFQPPVNFGVGSDHRIDLWDVATGAVRLTLKSHSEYIHAVVFSSNGKLLASCSDDATVKLWDVAIGTLYWTRRHSSLVLDVAFSPDCKLLASCGLQCSVKLWDVATGVLQRTLNDCGARLTFSSDGKLLASGEMLWDVATGALHRTLTGKLMIMMAISPDSKLLASRDPHSVQLWDVATGTLLQKWEVGTWVRQISFSKCGPYLETDRGLLRIQSTETDTFPLRSEPICDIFVKERWITREMKNHILLPVDYRPTCSAFHGNLLVLGHESGQITFMRFSLA